MHLGKTVFAQLMDLIPAHEFRRCVERYQGNYKVSTFSCWDQFLCMAFAQLTYRESLRDIETCLRTLGPRLYHAGVRGHVSRSTLADANETRDFRIYADLAQVLMATARSLDTDEDLGMELQQTVYALDSTTIDLRDDVALMRARFTYVLQGRAGIPVTTSGIAAEVFVRENGRWVNPFWYLK